MNTRIIAITAAVAMAGCRTNDRNGALVITKVVVGTAATGAAGSTCTFNAAGNESVFPTYVANALPPQVQVAAAGFVVQNQLINPSTLNTQLNTATNNFTARQAVVDYEIPGQSVAQQIIPAGGTVPNNFTGAIVVELASPEAVKTAIAAAAAAATSPDGLFVRTTVRIEGRLDDGSIVSTSAHDFVFHACSSGPTCAADACF